MNAASQRFADWGHWGLGFWSGERGATGARAVAELPFPVGPHGPQDGFLGSPERLTYREACRRWVADGVLPEGSRCSVSAAWLYDESYPGARWEDGRGWVSPVRVGRAWVFVGTEVRS